MDQTYNLETWFPFPPLGQPDAPVQLASSADASYVDGTAQFGTVAEIEIDSLSTSMCISITVDAQSSSKWLCLYHNHPPGYLSLSPLRLAACYDEPLASVFTKDADMRLVYVAYKDESISALTS